MTTNQKLMIGVLMLVAWFALVILQMTPVEPFVDALKWAGAGLGLVQATLTDPKAIAAPGIGAAAVGAAGAIATQKALEE